MLFGVSKKRTEREEKTARYLQLKRNVSIKRARHINYHGEIYAIICPNCASNYIWKNGHVKGEQRYLCVDCRFQWTYPDRYGVSIYKIAKGE